MQRPKPRSIRLRARTSRPAARKCAPASRRVNPSARPARYSSTSPVSCELPGRENEGMREWVLSQTGQIPRSISRGFSRWYFPYRLCRLSTPRPQAGHTTPAGNTTKGLVRLRRSSDNNDVGFRQESGRSPHLYSRSPYLFPLLLAIQEIGRKSSSMRKECATRQPTASGKAVSGTRASRFGKQPFK